MRLPLVVIKSNPMALLVMDVDMMDLGDAGKLLYVPRLFCGLVPSLVAFSGIVAS